MACTRSARLCSRTRSSQRTTPRSAFWARVACTRLPSHQSTFVSSRVLRSRCTSRQCSPKSHRLLLPPPPPPLLHPVRLHPQGVATRTYRCRSSRSTVLSHKSKQGVELLYYIACVRSLSGGDLCVNNESARPLSPFPPSPCPYAAQGHK